MRRNYDKFYELVSENVRNARLKAGMTQAQLAKRMRCTVPHISHMENGRFFLKGPALGVLLDFASALQVPLTELLTPQQEINTR